MKRVLITGASGFLGGAVFEELGRKQHVVRRALVYRREPKGAGAELVVGDLTRPETLDAAVAGVDAVLHLASHIGEDERTCHAVNARGTEALVGASARAGVRRFIYVSNAAVCGWAVHRGEAESDVRVAPVTPVSRSRALAERSVLHGGGVVLRPLFVYGSGDTRVLPTLDRALRRFRFLVDRGSARVSLIAVDDLARVVASLVELEDLPSSVLHVNDGHPTSVRDLAALLSRDLGTPAPRFSLPWVLARRIVRFAGRHSIGRGAGIESAEHRAFLLSRDHFFDSSRLWQLLGQAPPPPITERFAASRSWYEREIRVRRSPETS